MKTRFSPRDGHAPEGGIGPSLLRPEMQCWGQLKSVARWLDDSWIGDLIGVICIFGIWYVFYLFGWAMT